MKCTRLQVPSRYVQNTAEVYMITPGEKAEKYLIFFHGAGESVQTVMEHANLVSLAEMRNTGIILPAVDNSFGLNQGEGRQIHSFLTDELLPSLRNAVSVPLCVGGISMGAYIALSAGLERRDIVHRIVSISGAFDLRQAARFGRVCGLEIPSAVAEMESRPGERVCHLLKQCADGNKPALFFACGDGDLFYDTNRMAADWARELGYSVRWKETPGLHNWDYWREVLPPALQWASMTGDVFYGD